VHEADVKPRRTLSDATGCKANPLHGQPFDSLGQVVNPQADMVQRRGVNRRFFLDVERLHQIDLDLEGAVADGADVFINVLALADEITGDLQPQHVNPQRAKPVFAGRADGDLLNTQNLERPRHAALTFRRPTR
jgi:hypothetical protein